MLDVLLGQPARTEFQMCVMGDVDDPFGPLPVDCWLPTIEEARIQIDSLLNSVVALFADARVAGSCVGAAVGAALNGAVRRCLPTVCVRMRMRVLACDTWLCPCFTQAGRPAKLLVTQSGLPTVGYGRLASRENVVTYGSPEEKTAYLPAADASGGLYRDLGLQCIKGRATVDLFVCSNTFCDVPTVGQLSVLTGGQVRRYPEMAVKGTSQPRVGFMLVSATNAACVCALSFWASQGATPWVEVRLVPP